MEQQIFTTHEGYGEIARWRRVTPQQWDRLSDSQREILFLRDGKGIVFVQRVTTD